MHNYKITYRVDHTRTEQVVSANSTTDAKKLIQKQYPTSKVSYISIKLVK